MDLKQQVMAVIDVEREANDLLGRRHQNGNFNCYNKAAHNKGDANPSLSMNSRGLYMCHACGVKGDILQLIMDCKGMSRQADFGKLLKQLAAKYRINANTVRFETKRESVEVIKGFKLLDDATKRKWLVSRSKLSAPVMTRLAEQYGINEDTVKEYHLGYHQNRLWIPIPSKSMDHHQPMKTKMVNVRRHDVMRACCKFIKPETGEIFQQKVAGSKAYWGDSAGKTIGIRNHNVAYVYPMNKLVMHMEVWLVGGELKALLLNQLGVHAVCFTAGEGRYHKQLLKFFTNKIVRVVMDVDDAGERAAFGHTKKDGTKVDGLAQVLANNGAKEVYAGRLPKIDGMPDNGDVTDYLRLNNWNVDSLKEIQWTEFKPSNIIEAGFEDTKTPPAYQMPDFDEVEQTSFGGLLSPKNSGKVIKIPFVVSGRGETPYLLPKCVSATCEAGQMDARDICAVCPMSRNNFEMSQVLSDAERVDLVGRTPAQVKKEVMGKLNLPKCTYPDIQIESDSVEKLIVIPTLDAKSSGDQFNYRQHAIYSLGDDYLTENVAYEGLGRVLPEPKNSQYTWAMSKQKSLDNDIFNYVHKETEHSKLKGLFYREALQDNVGALIDTLRDNKLYKYGIDKLILYELLAFFMPFEFSLGKYKNYKVCPEVCILGEPRSGKSSTAKDLLTLYGAGRYVDAPTVTTIGLIGGNASFGKQNIFTWGAIPMCHRAICIIDECNKLDIQAIETLTNLRSSGVAERTTVSGVRKIRSNVRFLWLCNPRNGRALSHYGSPVRAAQEVFGSPQDLARLDLLHIQRSARSSHTVNSFHESRTEDWYTPEIARYHLQWAWSLQEHNIKFEDPIYIMEKARLLVDTYKTDLLPMAETKFKIARIASGLSALTYSVDRNNDCLVTNEAVDMAYDLLDSYKQYNIQTYSSYNSGLPDELRKTLSTMPPRERKRLKLFLSQDTATMAELKELLGQTFTVEFIQTAMFDLEIMKKRGRFFMWDEQLRGHIQDYLGGGNEQPW
jgi:hypothetical protein